MKSACAAGGMFLGVFLAVGGSYAQEATVDGGNATGQVKKAEPAVGNMANPDPTNIQQQQRARDATVGQSEIDAYEKTLRDADELLKGGKPGEAYALLEPLEFDHAGEVRFDYLLGISALDSGKPDKATLVFERVLAVDPNFVGARLDMARAYYQLGDLPRAKAEFEDVLKQNPPAVARTTIQKYLDAISAQEQAKQTRISGYIEGVLGYDSNIANNTAQTMMLPATSLLSVIFPTGIPPVARLSGFYEGINAGGGLVHSLDANWSLYAGADLRQHGNMAQTAYDTSSIDGRAGLMCAEEKNVYKLSLTGGQAYNANSMRRDLLGLSVEWQHVFSPTNQAGLFAQYGQSRATGWVSPMSATPAPAQTEGDTDLVVAGAGWAHVMMDGEMVLFASGYMGKELDVARPRPTSPAGGRPDGKKRFEGLRIGGNAVLAESWEGFASIGWQHAAFSQPSLFIAPAARDEYQYDLVLGVAWHLDKQWTLKPQLAFTRKNSNVTIYGFDRSEGSLTIRRDFQ